MKQRVTENFWQGVYNALPFAVLCWLVIIVLFFVFNPF